MIIFETERLVLRRLVIEDLDALYELYRDPEIRRYFPEGTLDLKSTRAELEWFLNGHPRHPELGLWATIHKPTGAFIGRCGLLPWMIEGRLEIEIAYLLGRPYWRQGLGSEVARGLVRYGFDRLGLKRLIALIDADNLASVRTAERAGLRFERDLVLDDAPCRVYAVSA
ncbi:MAG: GNAT family N-acetyltransferase [Anaerolineales bacterium]|nr:GNAT family N-acetyltransferase [Anaerolineales bacterium]